METINKTAFDLDQIKVHKLDWEGEPHYIAEDVRATMGSLEMLFNVEYFATYQTVKATRDTPESEHFLYDSVTVDNLTDVDGDELPFTEEEIELIKRTLTKKLPF